MGAIILKRSHQINCRPRIQTQLFQEPHHVTFFHSHANFLTFSLNNGFISFLFSWKITLKAFQQPYNNSQEAQLIVFYTQQLASSNPRLLIHPPTPFSSGIHKFVFCVCECFCFALEFICIIFHIPQISDAICLSFSA